MHRQADIHDSGKPECVITRQEGWTLLTKPARPIPAAE